MKAIRWSDNDRYLGPITYAHSDRYSRFGVILGSGDEDDYPGCRLRLHFGMHTLIIALPAIIKPHRRWHEIKTEPTRSKMLKDGRAPGYWDSYPRQYGFTTFEGSLHIYYGAQTHDSDTDKTKVWFYPWREHRQVRHSLYDLEGVHFADLPQWNIGQRNTFRVLKAIEEACPVAMFEFEDFDGQRIIATCRIEEREWRRGKGVFRLLYLGRNTIERSLDIQFSAEVGRRKGSWKGGTIGHSIKMLPGEKHEEAFQRYCIQENLTFIGSSSQ